MVPKEHEIFCLECGMLTRDQGEIGPCWRVTLFTARAARQVSSGIFIKPILSSIISALNISNKLSAYAFKPVRAKLNELRSVLLLIFLFLILIFFFLTDVFLDRANILHSCKRYIFPVYPCTVFAGVSGESVCLED